MSKNEKIEIKNWNKGQTKDKQAKANKKGRNDNKSPSWEGRRETDDISKAFPNFSVLTEEERLAFFQALTTARKNVEKKGVPTRICFGTVHDEYLKYFDQNDQDEEEKQEENRAIRSNFTLRDNGSNSCSDRFEVEVDQEHPGEKKCSPLILSSRSAEETPRERSTRIAVKPNCWKELESIIQMETDKAVDLFLKKKGRIEEKADGIQSDETISSTFEGDGPERSNWVAQRNPYSRRSDTPKFDALSPEEKEVFFKILQEAHDNVLGRNSNRKSYIFPLDAILGKYQSNEVTTVFATTGGDILRCGSAKRDLKVTVTVTSKDNERLLMNHSRLMEAFEKYKTENLYPLEVSTEESFEEDEDEDEDFWRSEEVLKRAENSLTDCRSSETGAPRDEPCKDTFKSLKAKTSFTNKQKKFCENETVIKAGNPKKSECQENALVVSDLKVCSFEKNLTAEQAGNVQLTEKDSGEAEEVECWSLISSDEEKSEERDITEQSVLVEKSKEAFKEIEPKREVQPKPEESSGLPKKVSFFLEDSKEENSEVPREGGRKENSEVPREGGRKENSEEEKARMREDFLIGRDSVKDNPGEPKAREYSLNRVMLVNGDVVGKIKRLIYYLEAKASKDGRLEKEYLKLLVDYADYLSKVLESLILKKEQQQKQPRNLCAAPTFQPPCHDPKAAGETEPKAAEFGFPSCTASEVYTGTKQPSVVLTEKTFEETPKEPGKEFDSNLPILSDSESVGSEGETSFMHRKDDRDRILTTKIRLLQDLLRQRAQFVEGSFDDFKIIQFPEKEFVPKEKPPTVKLLEEDETNAQQTKKRKFLKSLMRFVTCGKKKETTEEDIIENLKGEAVRVDKMKDEASAILDQATLEVLKAAERKKIIDKYFKES